MQKKLFIAMPYGLRKSPLDYTNIEGTTVEINFDEVWRGLIKPAIPEEFDMKRADELRQPGLIDRLYNEWLFDADIVLADLTFGNANVYYELGIRQALSRKGTVLIACEGTRLPFDVRNQYVIHYNYFKAPSIAVFQSELKQAIINASAQELDSPIHIFLPGLVVQRFRTDDEKDQDDPTLLRTRVAELEVELSNLRKRDEENRLLRKIREANSGARVAAIYAAVRQHEAPSVDLLEQLAMRLRQHGRFDNAIEVLESVLKIHPQDHEILRELGFAYRKKGIEYYDTAEDYMRKALEENDLDGEVHGMLGGLLKRKEFYDEALHHYEIAYELDSTDLYPMVNLGVINAALGNNEQAIDWYRKVDVVCKELIDSKESDYWTYLCRIEAAVAINNETTAFSCWSDAKQMDIPIEDIRSESEQLEFFVKIGFADILAKQLLAAIRNDVLHPCEGA